MAENKGLNIREGKTYLDAHSQKGEISFLHPAFGPGNYVNVGTQIRESGLEQPTMEQTAYLVCDAWQNPKEKYSKEIIEKMKTNWLWGFNGLLYVPKEGIYIQDRPEIRDGRVFMSQEDLVERLESNDKSVRFVEYDSFKRESQSSLELAKNPFIIALAGEEGADKLAQVADNYKIKPFLWTIDGKDVKNLQQRVASLYSFIVGLRLIVYGINWDGNGGYAFGVLNESRSDAPKK